eukprot:5605874-Prymnesium_polylepis.2
MEEAFERLIRGEKGSDIVKSLRPHFATNTLKRYACELKKRALDAGLRHPEFNDSALRKYENEEGIKQFLDAPIKAQLYLQKRHAKNKSWSKGAERALASLKILPDNLKSLKVTKGETDKIKRDQRATRRHKLLNVVRVHLADQLLQLAQTTLENASVNNTYVELCCSLAIVSGRRSTELLNQRSSFSQNGKWTCWFEGQLKKPPGAPNAYSIPLLVKPATFINAMAILRQKQGQIGDLTNEEVSALYNGSFKPERMARFMPILHKFHFTRTLYAQFVHHLFDHTIAYNALLCSILGHDHEKESIEYSSATLEDIDHLKRSYGPLVLPS